MGMNKPWRVGWKPIDKANATPKWSGVICESFAEANRLADSMNKTDPENHYFPDLVPEKQPEQCTDCGRVFEAEYLKPPPDPMEKGRLCPSCHESAIHALKYR